MQLNKFIINLRRSKFMRAICAPIIILQKKKEAIDYYKLPDSKEIKKYRGVNKGKRCFIIGNGSSLTVEDLEKLSLEYTFATNGIFYAFDNTEWRPTYYMSMDNSFLDSEINNIKKNVHGRKFLNYYCHKFGRNEKDDIVYILIKGPYKIDRKNFYQTDISEDVADYFAQTFSVTTTCIEFAIYMGFEEIYLLGVDNNYSNVADKKDNGNNNTSSNHFYKGVKSSIGIVHYADNQIKSYELYRDFAEAHGVKIYNVTRGGKLEVYPRRNLDEVLEHK